MFLVGLHLQELLIIKFMEYERIYLDYNASSLIRKEAFNLLEEIPWDIDNVKKAFLINVNEKSKKEAESLLLDQYVNGFDATNGTFLVRLEANKELKTVDVILSLVYDGKILHEKIKMIEQQLKLVEM